MAGSKRSGTGWTGRGPSNKTMFNKVMDEVTNAEITRAVEAAPESNVIVKIPAQGLKPIETTAFGEGQHVKIHTQAKTSVPNAKGDVKTTVRFHDADSSAKSGFTSQKQTTMAIEQGGKGNRRLVPDSTVKEGGRWVQKKGASKASNQDWGDAHIPFFKGAGGRAPFFPRSPILTPMPLREVDELALPGLLQSGRLAPVVDPNTGNKYLQWSF